MEALSKPVDLGHFVETDKTGRTVKFRIQQLTPDLRDAAIDHMTQYFVKREPLTAHLDFSTEPESIESIRELWRAGAAIGIGLVALLDDDSNPPTIIGVNMTSLSKKQKEDEKVLPGKKFNIVMDAVGQLTTEGNLFERYGVDEYMTAYGLSVHPDYHGLNVGNHLLAAREPLCKMVGIKMSATVFTAGVSQHLATKNKFEDIVVYDYKNFRVNGGLPFETLPGKIKLQARRFD